MGEKFFILFEARSGSSHLVSMLNSSPDVTCYSEIFVSQPVDVCERLLDALENGKSLHEINPWVLDDHGSIELGKPASCIGFKTKPYDLPGDFILNRLERSGFKLILLTRRNLIKQAVSRATGLKLWDKVGLYNAIPDGPTVSSVVVDPTEIIEIAEICDEINEQLHSTFNSWKNEKLHIEYEDLLYRETSVMESLSGFLSIPNFKPLSRTRKNTLDDLSIAVKNYDELAKALENHRFKAFLDQSSCCGLSKQ
ncbi:hypothetical protein MPLDJ20_80226 [Mesorhizobium plurifarium]|uniref:Sulphotransferase Stf0 domain-containing protein n=1 Tax=Mesorhizobium plurifarium TaxID=69974 RepID=A0A090FX12_MESPL|nr:hypothetical protein MPLDJ20_80226 [Mesorhizobium plurifarium]